MKKVLPVNDILFKKVFSSPQYSHILIGFINDVLELDVEDVTIENTYNIESFYDNSENPEFRFTQVDVLARLQSGSLVTIEMQVHRQSLFKERALYYATELYASNYGKRTLEVRDKNYTKSEWKYSALRPVYSICIMAEVEFKEDEDPIREFSLYDKKHQRCYAGVDGKELIQMVFLELQKYTGGLHTNIRDWFDYFRQGKVAENAPDYIKDACKVASYQNLERKEREMIDARERAEQDAISREHFVFHQGREEGEQSGRQEGRQEERKELISAMLANGKSIEAIAEFTGISITDIENLLK